MLSENIQTLADHLRQYASTRIVLDPPAVIAIVAVLDCAVQDARRLEQAVVPEAARRQPRELPEGVTSLSDVRAERQARAFIRNVEGPRGPGGAA